jgi:hypothetical protein
MITKAKDAKDACPSCKQTLVCREVEYKGVKKLQWQYENKEVAHFSFDFKSGKSACKESSTGFAETFKTSTQADELNISGLALDKKQQEAIMKAAEEGVERMLVVFSATQRKCRAAGLSHPATIGMIFNQVCENRRSSI